MNPGSRTLIQVKIEDGYLADIDITQIRINYPDSPQLTNAYITCAEYLNANDKVVDGKKVFIK